MKMPAAIEAKLRERAVFSAKVTAPEMLRALAAAVRDIGHSSLVIGHSARPQGGAA